MAYCCPGSDPNCNIRKHSGMEIVHPSVLAGITSVVGTYAQHHNAPPDGADISNVTLHILIQSNLFTLMLSQGLPLWRSDCILVYGSTTKGDVVKRSDCILVYGSTTKVDVVKRSDCILVYGSTTKGDVVKRSDCILVYGSTTLTSHQWSSGW